MFNIEPTYTHAVVLHTGAVLWLPATRALNLIKALESDACPKSLEINGQWVATSSVAGVYTAQEMRNIARRKAGEWQCEYQNWHPRGDRECGCRAELMRRKRQEEEQRQREEEEERERNLTPEEREARAARIRAIREGFTKLAEEKKI